MHTLVKEPILRNRLHASVGMASVIVAGLTLASRLVGLVRVRIFASTFGAGEVLDIYYAAFRIPDFLMGVLIVGTLSIAALPVISQYALKGKAELWRLVSNLLNITFLLMAVLCGLAAILAPWLVSLVVPGFSEAAQSQVVVLTRFILLAQVVLAVGTVMSTSLNALKRFVFAGLAPVLYNIGLIVGVLVFYPHVGMVGLAYGVVLGAVLHLITLCLDFSLAGFRWAAVFRLDRGMRDVLRLYLPRLFTIDLSQVSLLLAAIFGSLLTSGSIAVYALGFDIQAVPVGVFAFAIATASFPHLADYFAQKDVASFTRLLREGLARVVFFMLPIAMLLLLLRAHAVRILYGAGQFSWEDTSATFTILGILAFSLIGQSLLPLLSRALLARHESRLPVAANLAAVVINIIAALVLVPRFGINGVAMSYAVAVSSNALLLYGLLRSSLHRDPEGAAVLAVAERWLVSTIWKILSASLALALTSYGTLYAADVLLNTRTWIGLAAQAGVSTVVGGAVYLVCAKALRLSDATALWDLLSRILRKRVV